MCVLNITYIDDCLSIQLYLALRHGGFFMAVRKIDNGKWICECYPSGRSGYRIRKQFATKGEALAFERHMMDEA